MSEQAAGRLGNRFPLLVEFDSDWYVGSGTGRPGQVDRLVVKDHNGLPCVPAKTLTGIWRDACEQVAWGLDRSRNGDWTAWVTWLFGDQPALPDEGRSTAPRGARVWVCTARLRATLRERLLAQPRLAQALTFVKPGVDIDPESGLSRNKQLRFEEAVRAGAALESEAELSLKGVGEPERQAAEALLLAGLFWVEVVGGKRRRGPGRCRLRPVGIDDAALGAAWDVLTKPPPAPPAAGPTPSGGTPWVGAATVTQWWSLPLSLCLVDPVCVGLRKVGNVVESLDCVPGTYLLGVVTALMAELGLEARPGWASGELQVLPAYPEVSGARGRPAPLCLELRKDGADFSGQGDVWNRVADANQEGLARQLRRGYVGPFSGDRLPGYRETAMTVHTHNSVDDAEQRPNESTGGVYSYEAIAPETVLHAQLHLSQAWVDRLAEADPRWWERLGGRLVRLGRSKKDGYGRAQVNCCGPPQPVRSETAPDGDRVVVWLQSDLLLRDEALRADPSAERLGVVLADEAGGRWALEQAFGRVSRLDSWQQRWHLPRPSLVGLAAGSCFVFRVTDRPAGFAASLERLAAAGLGERRAEGYGQLSFGDALVTSKLAKLDACLAENDGAPQPHPPEPLTEAETPEQAWRFAQGLEQECWRAEMRRQALTIAGDAAQRQALFGWSKDHPGAAQLGALRAVVATVHCLAGRERLQQWLKALRAVKQRDRKWKGALDKLEHLLLDEAADALWRALGAESWPVLTADGGERLRRELWAEAARTLVDAAIRAEARLDQPEDQEGGR